MSTASRGTTQRQLGIGVIGVGLMGKTHATNLRTRIPNARLVGISDLNLALAQKVGRELGVSDTYSDYRQLLSDDKVEAVIIATPSFAKLELVTAALEAGKSVFCEKPLCVTLDDADQLVQAAEKSHVVFQMGFQRRFDPSLMRVRDAIHSGTLGRILLITSKTRDPPGSIASWEDDPKLSGGIFNDTCSHDFDILRWISGSEMKSLFAMGKATMMPNRSRVGNYDTVVVSFTLSNDAIGHVDSCAHTLYGYDTRVEVIGTEADILTSIGNKSECHIFTRENRSNDFSDSYYQRFDQAYRDEVADFVDCVQNERTPRSNAKDGRAAVEIGIASAKSVRESAVVSLPLR
ncbi:MAG: Gfo/Idh/MocA family oxidoreductase [Thaumarchaeota archaeon]|nr:Gfo/Idh/MocA family oxidoreductase [Nitrososphaerota archaeon]